MTGCLACSSAAVCTSADIANHFILSGTTTVCDTGYLLVAGSCKSCGLYLPGCTDCSSTTFCSACMTVVTGVLSVSGNTC